MIMLLEKENKRNIRRTPLTSPSSADGRRRGSALATSLIAMIVLGLLSGSVLTLATMNLNYTKFFENSAVLQQATVSLASSVAENLIRDYRQPFWSSMPEGTSHVDEFVLDRKNSGLTMPIRLRYEVTHRAPASWTVTARGEYAAPGTSDNLPAPWAVSADVAPRKARAVTWEIPVHVN